MRLLHGMSPADAVRWASAGLGGLAGFLIGEINGLVYALIAMMAIDYATGVTAAFIEKRLDSAAGFRGIAKKVFILLLVITANVLDRNLLGGTGAARACVICFYAANEGLSILENAARIGVPCPPYLRRALARLKEADDEKLKGH